MAILNMTQNASHHDVIRRKYLLNCASTFINVFYLLLKNIYTRDYVGLTLKMV